MKTEAISKFYQTYRLFIFPGIVTLSSLVLIIFVIYPQTAKLITNQQVQGEILNKSKFLEAKAQVLESYDSEDLNRKVNFAIGAYPTEKDFVFSISLLQGLISQAGFNVVALNLGSNSAQDPNLQSYNLRAQIEGPVLLLPTLLSRIENSPRLMKVSNIEINSERDPQKATVDLSVDVFYSSAPKEFGNIDSELPELTQKDEDVISKLAKSGTSVLQPTNPSRLGPRGKDDPFE